MIKQQPQAFIAREQFDDASDDAQLGTYRAARSSFPRLHILDPVNKRQRIPQPTKLQFVAAANEWPRVKVDKLRSDP